MPALGELEEEVMAIVWESEGVTVKDVLARLARERAYNTVQTTLDRLFRKALLRREKHSHSFVYTARVGRADYHRGLIATLVGELLPKERAPVLAAFVDIAADADLENLDRLEKLIEAKRKAKRGRR
jgi:predicted transcriptional regulator